MQSWGRSPVSKVLVCKPEDLRSDPQHPDPPDAVVLRPQHSEGRNRKIPVVLRPASLEKSVRPRVSETLSKIRWRITEEDT